MKSVSYYGTKGDWNAISIGDNNDPLTGATLQLVSNPFKDVSSSSDATYSWFYTPMVWAAENNVLTGYGNSYTFSAFSTCTRAEFVTMLYRLAGSPAVSGTSPFVDEAEPTNSNYLALIAQPQ